MNTIKSKLRTVLTAFFASLSLLFAALGFVACGANNLKIDVPERIEEDMGTGTYVVPRYDVVNDIGVIMAGYTVRLKSVTDPNGEAAEISREASTIVTLSGAGEYTFVYTADSKRVKDATVIMDFADRKAPTIKLSSSQFPAFFIQGVTYAVPEYTLSGDFVASKCYTKVFYNDGQSEEETEVTMDDGSFTVTNAAGKYTVLIHVEDAAGNFNEYRYTRSVHSPEHYDEHTVVYFNEAFGEKQVTPDGNYAGHYVSVADGGKGHDGEAGSYKVVFNGKETTNNEAYFSIDVPAIANIMAYKELEMYVYIEDDECAGGASEWVVGSKWWNDQRAKVGEWTRITWSVANWGNGTGANCGSTTANVISTDNISGTRIRLIPDCDYEGKTAPHGTVYFSSMRVVPYDPSVVTAGENVTLDKRDGNYHIGDTVTLTAAEIEGKTLDCFLLDGKPIGGNTFVASNATHAVTAKYVDGALTADNMTWGEFEAETVTDYEGWVNFCKTGIKAEKWIVRYTVKKDVAAGNSIGVYLGSDHWAEIENGTEKKLHAHLYGDPYWTKAADLSDETVNKLQTAGTTNVSVTWARNGSRLLVLLDGEFVGAFNLGDAYTGEIEFGTMYRGNVTKDTIDDIQYVAGDTKSNLFFGTLAVTLTKDANVATDQENYYLGDTVTLTAAEAPAGKAFAYFTVDGEPITGNTFVLRKFSCNIAAVYADISELTLGEGIATADGKTTVGKGATVTLTFTGKSSAGKYFKGFKVDGASIGGNTFVTSKSAHSITAEFADRVQNDNVILNDASKVQGTDDWCSKEGNFPTKVEYVTDFYYDGIDASVPEDGVLKVTVSGADNGFSLTQTCGKFMSDYESLYFYAYTEASGVKVGSWWCADTTLTPGKWCKVEITRDMNLQGLYDEYVWKTQIEKFVYRFMSCKAGDVFYVTEVFGVPYADVTVTVDGGVKDYVSVSAPANGKTYKANEMITLSHSGTPANQEFAYFTINGERYDGSTYTLGTEDVTVGAVFTDISTLTLGDGVTTSDGKTRYGRGVTVTLVYNDTVPQGKVFDCFKVDNEPISGNTFVTDAATHIVGAVFVENAADMTWAAVSSAGAKCVNGGESIYAVKLSNADSWALRYTVTNLPAGGWGQLTGVYLGATSQIASLQFSGSQYTFNLYGGPVWSGSETISAEIAAVIKGASAANPVTLTFVKVGNDLTAYASLSDGSIYKAATLDIGGYLTNAAATDDFGFAYRDANFGAPTLDGDIEFIVGEGKAGLYLASLKTTVSYTKAGAAVNKDYYIGDTVTLIRDPAEQGYVFLYYTVDGREIKGDSFVVTKVNHSVAAVYAEVSQLTLGEGVLTADENTEYARGVRVRLSFDPAKLNGKVVDYYLIDKDTENELRVYNGEFTTTAATHTVDAVLALPSEMTWANGGTDYNYETVMGSDSAEWKARALDGEVYGSAKYWAVSVDVKFTSDWKSFEFIQGSKQSIRVRFHDGGFCGVVLMTSKDDEDSLCSSDFTVAYPTKNPQVVAKLLAGATVTCVRNGGTISMYVDGYQFFKTDYPVDHTGNWFGVGHVDSQGATKPEMNNTKYITGKDKVEALLTSYATTGLVQSSGAQINWISGATISDTTTEYITTGIPAGLSDETVKEAGVLKFTAGSNDVAFTPTWTFETNQNKFSELYYYVYIQSDDALANVSAGAYWKDNTQITANTWVKVTLDSAMIAELTGVKDNGLSAITIRIYSQTWIDGYTAIQGKTVYVTSLYGVPKTAE